jgi:hypothetical protein
MYRLRLHRRPLDEVLLGMKVGFAVATFIFVFFGLAYCMYYFTFPRASPAGEKKCCDISHDEEIPKEEVSEIPEVAKTDSDGSHESFTREAEPSNTIDQDVVTTCDVQKSSTIEDLPTSLERDVVTTCDVHKCSSVNCTACHAKVNETMFIPVEENSKFKGVSPRFWWWKIKGDLNEL